MAQRQLRAASRYPTFPVHGALAACGLMALAACSEAGGDSNEATGVPSRSGDVWVLDSAGSQSAASAALLAFVSGTHVLVVDGDETFAGMQVTHGGKAPDGGQPLTLSGGIDATLAPSGNAMRLKFASGETMPLRKRRDEKIR